jgi:hypothetical protein
VNRAPRTGPRLVAERKRRREREIKETAEAAEAAGTADIVEPLLAPARRGGGDIIG